MATFWVGGSSAQSTRGSIATRSKPHAETAPVPPSAPSPDFVPQAHPTRRLRYEGGGGTGEPGEAGLPGAGRRVARDTRSWRGTGGVRRGRAGQGQGSGRGRPTSGPSTSPSSAPGTSARSPMAEAVLRARLGRSGAGDHRGIGGPAPRRARGRAHRGEDHAPTRHRHEGAPGAEVSADLLAPASLILGMERQHVRKVVGLDGSLFARSFTLPELVHAAKVVGARDPTRGPAHLGRAHRWLPRPTTPSPTARPRSTIPTADRHALPRVRRPDRGQHRHPGRASPSRPAPHPRDSSISPSHLRRHPCGSRSALTTPATTSSPTW